MQKRPLSEETKNKILQCAASILSMHGEVAGNRICQDWSGSENLNPRDLFTDNERDDIEYNSQIENSNLSDYEKGLDFFGDEMSISFVMANAIRDLAI